MSHTSLKDTKKEVLLCLHVIAKSFQLAAARLTDEKHIRCQHDVRSSCDLREA